MFKTIRLILHTIAKIQLSILFFFLYIAIVTPFGLLQRVTRKKPLTDTTWSSWTHADTLVSFGELS